MLVLTISACVFDISVVEWELGTVSLVTLLMSLLAIS